MVVVVISKRQPAAEYILFGKPYYNIFFKCAMSSTTFFTIFFHSIIHQDVVSTVCFESFLSALVALKFSRASLFPLVLPFMFQWFIFSFLFSSHPWLCNDSGRTGFFVV